MLILSSKGEKFYVESYCGNLIAGLNIRNTARYDCPSWKKEIYWGSLARDLRKSDLTCRPRKKGIPDRLTGCMIN